jgi:hypothetical protein
MTQRPIAEIVEELFNKTLDCKLVPADIRQAIETERRQARQEGYNAGLADGTGKPLIAIEAENERLGEVVGEILKADVVFGFMIVETLDPKDERYIKGFEAGKEFMKIRTEAIAAKHNIDITPNTPQV